MLSPQEQKQTIGDLMLRRSIRSPSEARIWPVASLLPTNRLSAIHCISPALSENRTAPPGLELRGIAPFSVSTFE